MLTTAEAAALLAERGVTVKGRGQEPHPPTARTVEHWCRTGALAGTNYGGRVWLIEAQALDDFTPPIMGSAARRGPTGKGGEQ